MYLPRWTLVLAIAIFAAPQALAARGDPSRAAAGPVDTGRQAIRTFTDQDGLPQNAITALAFDHQRYLWVGTKDGAAYYDGRRWHVVNLPAVTGSNWVQSILVASDGSIWVGTMGGGAARYDGAIWTAYERDSGIGGAEVNCLIEAAGTGSEPVILAGTSGGVARFEGGAWHQLPPLAIAAMSGVKCLREVVARDGSRELWAGTASAGVARLRDGEWTIYTTETSGLPDDRVSDLVVTSALDGHATLVAATYGGGLARWDGSRWSAYTGARAPSEKLLTCLREAKAADGSPVLWAGTYRGVARYEAGRWVETDARSGLPDLGVWSLLDTPSPNGARTIWIGTAGGGLVRWELGRWVSFDKSSGLPNNSVYAVLTREDARGEQEVWAGTISGGLAHFAAGRWTALTLENGWLAGTVLCLLDLETKPGSPTLLAGTNDDGLAVLEGGRWRLAGKREGLPSSQVTCLARTEGGGGGPAAWVGTDRGLARFEDGRAVAADPALRLPDSRVRSVLETVSRDGARTLWVGTERGLARFENGRTTVYDRASGLPNDVVLCLTEVVLAGGRELWAGTRGGVARLALDAPDADWRHLSTATSLAVPNDTIYQVRQDARGRVYLFTNQGVARLTERSTRPSSFDGYTFTTEDGLPSNECNTGASHVDASGRIWAGTIKGLAVFDPSLEIDDPTPKPLVVKQSVFGTPAVFPAGARLAHDENHVLFEFSLLSFFRESDTRYRTQLVGFDAHPSEWRADFKKEYTSLPGGDYRFMVWGMDAAGNVSGPVEIPFEILPAPWFTWWAYALYVASLAALVWLAFRYRVQTLRRRNLMLEARIEERTAELARKVEALRESERRAQATKDGAMESERRARESERHALDASRAKSVFLANMSHELRTPLNAILGFVQLMERDRKLNAEQRENLGVIMRSGEHLLALINGVLSLSKIEAGHEQLDAEPFDLVRLLGGIEEMFRLRAESKGLALEFALDEGLPRYVRGDEGKLRQVLINLLGNAVKFTREGGVALRATWRDGRATFAVEDTGPGLGPDELPSLFKAFVQTKSGLSSQEGTGLGLAISRDFALLMNGDITVESEPGRGSTFIVEVDLPATDEAEPRRDERRVVALEPGQAPMRVLVVDDLPENRRLLAKLLCGVGFEVAEAANGREAVERWEREAPEMILMDVRMPVMDGISATRAIRLREGLRARELARAPRDGGRVEERERVRIVALTATAFEHDRDAILASGCDDYVLKPFRESAVFEKLGALLGARFVYEEASEAPAGRGRPSSPAVTPARLASVPPELLGPFARAVTIGDVAAALESAERLRAHDAALADELRLMVRAYRFDDLLDLLAACDARRATVGE